MMIRIWTLSIFTLIINCVFAPIVNAAENVSVSSSTTTVKALEEFTLNVTGNGFVANASYYTKAIGGDENHDVQTKSTNGGWLNWNTSWSEMPQVISSSEGNITTTLTVRFKDSTSTGNKSLKLRVVPINNTSDDTDSEAISFSVTAVPSPSPTTTPTASPTPSPVPTASASPNSTPTTRPTVSPRATTLPTPPNVGTVLSLSAEESAPPYSFLQASPTPISDDTAHLGGTPIAAAGLIGVGSICMVLAVLPFFRRKEYNKNSQGEQLHEATLKPGSDKIN